MSDAPSSYDTYVSPLATRNASPEMLRIWSARHKFNTWRRIWLAIAEAQHEVTKGWETPLVSAEQVAELRAVVERGITDAEIERAAELERDLRHDVMAHVHCLGEQCPKAKAIIHLGCTSQDVVCNADLLLIGWSLDVIGRKVARVACALADRSADCIRVPSLGFTHYQAAQPVTMGRRLGNWASDLAIALEEQPFKMPRFRGLRGATGTQASFLALLQDDAELVNGLEYRFIGRIHRWRWRESCGASCSSKCCGPKYDYKAANLVRESRWEDVEREALAAGGLSPEQVDEAIRADRERREPANTARDFTYAYTFPITGQTYPRVYDASCLAYLASIASVLHKIATDIRLLSNRKEIDEPFGSKQIGSSAMPYKRNPMKCERICGLTRFVMNLVGNAYDTAATQWLERTLDDSSNRRLSLPEAFLALDGALDLMHQVASGLVVHEAMVRKNLMAELPFLATENILMAAVKAGGDRQDLHEKIRVHAQAAGMRVKAEGLENDLIERLRADPAFASVHHLLTEEHLLDPMQYVGRSVEQTERFIREVVEPLRERYGEELEGLEASDRGV